MLRSRVIPFLLVKNHGLVKTTKFDNPRYLGDPINAIRIFNEKEVDELALLDIGATPASGPNFGLVKDVASECFMPLAYGGGIRGLEDAKHLFGLGIEKVILRSAAAKSLDVITEIANHAGASSVAVSIDVKQARFGRSQFFCPGSQMHGDSDWQGFLRRAVEAGAGEIILNAVDRDGTMSGMDTRLISAAADDSSVPVIAVGGVGSLGDISKGLKAGADSIGAGAFFVFHGPRRAVLITYPDYEKLSAMWEAGDE